MTFPLHINSDTIVYITCPAVVNTGGPELLHQLSHALVSIGINVKMYYYPLQQLNPKPATFDCYTSSEAHTIIDEKNNILIVPEVNTELLNDYIHIQKIVWWLSIDNFYDYYFKKTFTFYFLRIFNKASRELHLPITINIPNYLQKFMQSFSLKELFSPTTKHFVQSGYAKQHLLKKEISGNIIYFLSDYLNQEFTTDTNSIQKDNIVLYNPRKGFDFTKKLLDFAPEIRWVALSNMNRLQVIDTLKKAKVYIDFGHHPGKDRFPREAAILGCCIITNKKGSAYYYEDLPIPDSYKFDDCEENIPNIISKITQCLQNYQTETTNFINYKQFIISEERKFHDDVTKLFGYRRG